MEAKCDVYKFKLPEELA